MTDIIKWFDGKIMDAILHDPVRAHRAFMGFYPSSASCEWEEDGIKIATGGCLRQQAYLAAQIPETNPISPDNAIKAYFGNWMHMGLVEATKRAGIWRGDEVRFFRPATDELPPLSGRGDQFVPHPDTGRPVGAEYKTIDGYYAIKACLGDDGRPKEDHVLQSLVCLDYYSQWGVDLWILYYVARGDGSRRGYTVEIGEDTQAIVTGPNFRESWDRINMRSVNERWKRLQTHLKKKELPPRDYAMQWSNDRILLEYRKGRLNKTDTTAVKKRIEKNETEGTLLEKGDWNCRFCSFANLCWTAEWHDGLKAAGVQSPFDPVSFKCRAEGQAVATVTVPDFI